MISCHFYSNRSMRRCLVAVFSLALFALATSYKKPAPEIMPGDPDNKVTHQQTSVSADEIYTGMRNLNVVYFVPSDNDTIVNFRNRLNGILLQGQRFVRGWMIHWGYNDMTFGLTKDSQGRANIIVIRGQKTKDQYPYRGGGGNVQAEVNAYFAANPGQKTSHHILVIIPAASYAADGDPGGVPFYGMGRWCFTQDYAQMDTSYLGQNTVLGNRATKWIGGLMHELGHGINLPHNGGAQSENLQFGTSLMGRGNYTYGKLATFLSPADAAILSVNEIFSPVIRTDWYTSGGLNLTRLNAGYNTATGSIVVSGRFTSGKAVKQIAFYHRNKDIDNGGYRSVTFATQPIGTASFYISMPLSDFRQKGNANYELTIAFCHENGSITKVVNDYSFQNDIPVINFEDRPVYSKAAWTVVGYSSQETAAAEGRVTSIIDGNSSTFWHSRWSSGATDYPHIITVDMGASLPVNRFSFKQRNSRRVKNIEILSSNDNVNFTSLGNFVLSNTSSQQHINLGSTTSFRYFKLNFKNAWDGLQFAAMCEVGTYRD